MMMTYEKFDQKVKRAKKKLLDRQLLALDGSGDPDIESVFALLSLLRNGALILHKQKSSSS